MTALLFWIAPGLDLAASSLFYRPGQGFYLRNSAYAQAWYEGIPLLRSWLVLPGSLLLLALWAARRRLPLGITLRALLLFLLTLGLGWALLVNELVKNHSGRARPRDVSEFGGDRVFTPAFVPADQCEKNCSFVSGHTAFVFSGFALALVARRRRAAILLVCVAGTLAGLGRVMQGAHFLSDVVFSGVFMFAVAWLLHRALYREGSFVASAGLVD